MAAGGAGYFNAGYFHDNYWHIDYWSEITAGGGGASPIRRMGYILRIGG